MHEFQELLKMARAAQLSTTRLVSAMEPKDNNGQVKRNWSMDNLPSRLMQKREEELRYPACWSIFALTVFFSGAPSKVPAPKAGEALSLCKTIHRGVLTHSCR